MSDQTFILHIQTPRGDVLAHRTGLSWPDALDLLSGIREDFEREDPKLIQMSVARTEAPEHPVLAACAWGFNPWGQVPEPKEGDPAEVLDLIEEFKGSRLRERDITREIYYLRFPDKRPVA